MTPQQHPRVAWLLLAFALSCGAVTAQASPWPERDEESIRVLRAELLRIDEDVKQGKRTKEEGQRINRFVTERINELEEQLPARRHAAEVGKADARRDLARGKIYYYTIDPAFFAYEWIWKQGAVQQADWKQAMAELVGATILPVRPNGGDVWLLAARLEGYNEQVWKHLRARHGQDIDKRVPFMPLTP